MDDRKTPELQTKVAQELAGDLRLEVKTPDAGHAAAPRAASASMSCASDVASMSSEQDKSVAGPLAVSLLGQVTWDGPPERRELATAVEPAPAVEQVAEPLETAPQSDAKSPVQESQDDVGETGQPPEANAIAAEILARSAEDVAEAAAGPTPEMELGSDVLPTSPEAERPESTVPSDSLAHHCVEGAAAAATSTARGEDMFEASEVAAASAAEPHSAQPGGRKTCTPVRFDLPIQPDEMRNTPQPEQDADELMRTAFQAAALSGRLEEAAVEMTTPKGTPTVASLPQEGEEAPGDEVDRALGPRAIVVREQWTPGLPPGWQASPTPTRPFTVHLPVNAPDSGASSARQQRPGSGASGAPQQPSTGGLGSRAATPLMQTAPAVLVADAGVSGAETPASMVEPLAGGRSAAGSKARPEAFGTGSTSSKPGRRKPSRHSGLREPVPAPPKMEYLGPSMEPLRLTVGGEISVDPRVTLHGKPIEARDFSANPPLPEGLHVDAATGRVQGKPVRIALVSRHDMFALVDVPQKGTVKVRGDLVFTMTAQAPSRGPTPNSAKKPLTRRRTVLPSEPTIQPYELRKMQESITNGDCDHLQSLVERRLLKADMVDSEEFADDKGNTMLMLARDGGHQRVIALMYALVRVTTPAQGKQARKSLEDDPGGTAISYPTMPHELVLGRQCRFFPQVTSSDGLPRSLSPESDSNSRAPHYSVTPPLPAGLVLECQTGLIRGAPLVETGESIHIVSLSTVDSMQFAAKAGLEVQASTRIRLTVVAALRGLSYPRHECIVDPAENVTGAGEPKDAPGFQPLAATLPPLGGGGLGQLEAMGRQTFGDPFPKPSEVFGKEHTTKLFRLLPSFEAGAADAFHAEPPLPEGMVLDKISGEIRGVPQLKVAQIQRRTSSEHTIVAKNAVGMSTCRIKVEAHSGSWGLVLMKVYMMNVPLSTSADPAGPNHLSPMLPEGTLQDGATHPQTRPWTAGNVLQVDWTDTCEMGRTIIASSGRTLSVRSGTGAGMSNVRGMPAAALVDCLGFGKEPNGESLLLQAVRSQEQFAERRASLLSGGAVAHGDVAFTPSLALAEDAQGRPVVYLPTSHEEASALPAVEQDNPGASALPKSARKSIARRPSMRFSDAPVEPPPVPAVLLSARKLENSITALEDTQGVRKEFENLVPLWRDKLKETSERYDRRLASLAKWKMAQGS